MNGVNAAGPPVEAAGARVKGPGPPSRPASNPPVRRAVRASVTGVSLPLRWRSSDHEWGRAFPVAPPGVPLRVTPEGAGGRRCTRARRPVMRESGPSGADVREVDVVVVGGGPAGEVVAGRCADRGLDT